MENFIVSLNCVIPMFLTLCVGFLVRRAQVVPEVMFHHLSTLSFQALLPCLLFYNIYSTDLTAAVQSDLLAYLIAWVLVWFALCYAYYTLREPDPRRRGAYIQNSFRSNIAVIGVSLAQVMMSSHGVALLSIAISLVVPLFNILAVITLETWFTGKLLGRGVLRAEIGNLVYSCDGVANYVLTAPAADVAAQTGVLPVLGSLSVGGMA